MSAPVLPPLRGRELAEDEEKQHQRARTRVKARMYARYQSYHGIDPRHTTTLSTERFLAYREEKAKMQPKAWGSATIDELGHGMEVVAPRELGASRSSTSLSSGPNVRAR